MGVGWEWRWANAKSTFLSTNVLEVHYKTTHFLIYKEIVSRPGTKLQGVAIGSGGPLNSQLADGANSRGILCCKPDNTRWYHWNVF